MPGWGRDRRRLGADGRPAGMLSGRQDDPAGRSAATMTPGELAIGHGDHARPLDPARVHAFQRRVLERVERELER